MKKLLIINGSPRYDRGASSTLIEDMKPYIKVPYDVCFSGGLNSFNDELRPLLKEADSIMFVFPVYVDSLPSNLTYCLKYIYDNKEEIGIKKDAKIFVYAQCGLHEADQTETSIDIIRNWAQRMDLQFVQAVGFGASGTLLGAKKFAAGEGIKRDMPAIIETLMKAVETGQGGENQYATVTISREEYQAASEAAWRKLALRNGLEEIDLDKRW